MGQIEGLCLLSWSWGAQHETTDLFAFALLVLECLYSMEYPSRQSKMVALQEKDPVTHLWQ